MSLAEDASHVLDVLSQRLDLVLLLAVGTGLVAVSVFFCWKRAFQSAYAVQAGGLAFLVIFGIGDDTFVHAFRTLAVADQFRNAKLDLFGDVGGYTLPVFYFYTTLPYSLAAPLTFIGIPSVQAVNIVSASFLLILAYGIKDLVSLVYVGPDRSGTMAAFFSALFLGSNYVYQNFVVRAALPEAMAYALVPFAVAALLRNSYMLAMAIIALQIIAHPPIFPQALFLQVVLILTFAKVTARFSVRALLSVCGALLLSSPAWLPAFAHRHSILGIDNLPVTFEQTFLTPTELLNPLAFNSIGPYLLIMVFVALYRFGRSFDIRTTILFILFACVFLWQSTLLRGMVVDIPLMDISLFIWRWMFVAAMLGMFAVFLAWRGCVTSTPLAIVLALSIAQSLIVATSQSRGLMFRDAEVLSHFKTTGARNAYGIGEFLPDYRELPDRCDLITGESVTTLSFPTLREQPIVVDKPVLLRDAPIGIVRYTLDGRSVALAHCDGDLVLNVSGGKGTLKVSGDLMVSWPALKYLPPVIPVVVLLLFLIRKARRWRGPRDFGFSRTTLDGEQPRP